VGRSIKYARAQAALRPETHSTVEAVGDGYAIYAGDGSPVNGVRGLGMSRPVTPDDLLRVEQFFSSRSAIPRLDVCPFTDGSLIELLNARGLRLDTFYNILVRDLSGDRPAPSANGIDIRRATPDQADLWIRTTAQGFSGQDAPPQADLDILAPNFHSQDAVCFFAWVDSQPVGGGAMYLHKNVAELGGASTRPAYRRRGVQAALLHARLSAAREMGCDLALVMTEPGSESQRNIERAGFQVAYTRMAVSLRP
jgi:GNAT superfamily N-acetyltransferase